MDLDEKLISLVQRNGCIYDLTAKYYGDKYAKSKAWRKISDEMGIPVPECIIRWKKIRDSYRRALNLRQKRGDISRPLKFKKELEFLNPYLQERNADDSDQPSAFDRYPISPKSGTASPEPLLPVAQIELPSYIQQPEITEILEYIRSKTVEDPTESFFLCMAKTVKTMPSKMQAIIKREVFGLVNKAELRLATQNDVESDEDDVKITPNTSC